MSSSMSAMIVLVKIKCAPWRWRRAMSQKG
jgi:hypothetical protein